VLFAYGSVPITLSCICRAHLNVYLKGETVSLLVNCDCYYFLTSGSNVEVLMSGNVRCYNLVVEAMKAFPTNENIQEVSCSLFQKLTLGEFNVFLSYHKLDHRHACSFPVAYAMHPQHLGERWLYTL
jgi:hypothetical protein